MDAHRPSLSTSHSTISRALSSDLNGLILFDLTNQPGSTLAFSPHCIKTVVDLAILNIGYERQRLTFHQVRTDLEARTQPGVTVPSVEMSDGTHLVDSWAIAEFLAKHHPEGHKLFPTMTSKRMALFLSEVGRTFLTPNLGPLVMPSVAAKLDDESRRYFVEEKLGKERFNKMSAIGAEERQAYIDGAKKVLGTVEAMLGCNDSGTSSTSSSPWLDSGESPSHADAILYGFVVFSRMAGKETYGKLWNGFPSIKAWIEAMDKWIGEGITKDYVQW
ncbi:hypothetical protein BDZ90DRAFT_218315 [Jaminaea rosea]|uniref:GST N-terminal domain-containing protein n=1 Tax=Jaminaea rosea TaxID=1569628 RepID=A0A316UUJ0_9BASI|nr:hypothetical protein BDZ90DRAFT_218315 [Jaminaea rosea]PWN28902.1 hypothetical protein BDZ90DRAFT_218315 [Jaminaea rosea]